MYINKPMGRYDGVCLVSQLMYAWRAMNDGQSNTWSETDHRLVLAPMEGVMDSIMRDLLTAMGGYDRCVTEFVRISQTTLPSRVFHRLCPELHTGGRTPAGVPVFVQLLGSDPALMAKNARVAVNLGAQGIDLNFGCPAKTVNKSHGGAVLLKTPETLRSVCAAVRDAVPPQVPVTAKIRLGFDDDSQFPVIVKAALAGGISELTIHARTRRQAYRPPAHWSLLAEATDIAGTEGVPIIANGELWSPGDVLRCRRVSGCRDFMLARGALCRPDLGRAVRAALSGRVATGANEAALNWSDILPLLRTYLHRNAAAYEPRYACNPLKQWLVYLQYHYPQAGALFAKVKRLRDFNAMDRALVAEHEPLPTAA